jgi:hypothetical protein
MRDIVVVIKDEVSELSDKVCLWTRACPFPRLTNASSSPQQVRGIDEGNIRKNFGGVLALAGTASYLNALIEVYSSLANDGESIVCR